MAAPRDSDPGVSVVHADLRRVEHAAAVRSLTAAYAEDAMGNGRALSDEVLDRLVAGLRSTPTAAVWLAYAGDTPVGLATCFIGFSTFAARPLINVHDLAVLPDHRGLGVGRALLSAVEQKARELGCVKITLEVGELNRRARDLYEAVGFRHTSAGQEAGVALFYSKQL